MAPLNFVVEESDTATSSPGPHFQTHSFVKWGAHASLCIPDAGGKVLTRSIKVCSLVICPLKAMYCCGPAIVQDSLDGASTERVEDPKTEYRLKPP